MNKPVTTAKTHQRFRGVGAALFGILIGCSTVASALASDVVTLRVGDQKGGNRALLEIAGLAKDLPYKIEWSEFPAAAPILEALNAGALDFGYTGDLAFLTVYATGAPIKAIGGTRSDARTQAILVRNDSPIKSLADLKGKRLAGTRGGWGQFLIDATLEKAGNRIDDATFAPLGPVDADRCLGRLGALRLLRDPQGQRTDCCGRRRSDADDYVLCCFRSGDRNQARRGAGSCAAARQGAAMVAGPCG
jgi:sulfonate transport system substrate-binding protein